MLVSLKKAHLLSLSPSLSLEMVAWLICHNAKEAKFQCEGRFVVFLRQHAM